MPIGSLIVLLGAAIWLNNQIGEIKAELTAMRIELTLQQKIQWSVQHQTIFALKFKLANPTLVVPDTPEITGVESSCGLYQLG